MTAADRARCEEIERLVGMSIGIELSFEERAYYRTFLAELRGIMDAEAKAHAETDPPELLPDLLALAKERGNWIGLGLMPPREGKEAWVRDACRRIPEGVHVHGWALRTYTHVRRLNSTDSTNWWRDAMKLRTLPDTQHLTYGECLAIVVKRYQRWQRTIRDKDLFSPLFSED